MLQSLRLCVSSQRSCRLFNHLPISCHAPALCPAVLANMRVAEVVFLAVTDVVMVASGYAGVSTDDNHAIWPYFMFG